MPKTGPVQGFMAALSAGTKTALGSQTDLRQDGASFDSHLAATQSPSSSAKKPPKTAQHHREESSTPPDLDLDDRAGATQPSVGEEAKADDQTAAAVVSVLMPVMAVWTAGNEAQDIAPEHMLAQAGDGQALQAMEPAPVQPIPMENEDVNILERPADPSAEASPDSVFDARVALETQAKGIMDDPAALAARSEIADTSARMPTEAPILSWEVERQDAQSAPSSLENADTEETEAPPPSRVEITQVVRTRSETQGAQSDNRQDKADMTAAFSVQDARAASSVADQESVQQLPPVAQIAEEAQIQNAMGRTQFTMRLAPEALGEVTVRLTLTTDGLTARIITQTESARNAIASEIAQLGDSMREKGIDVRAVQVLDGGMGHASLLHDGNGRGNQGQTGRGRSRAVAVQGSDIAEAPPENDPYAVTDGLIDETAGIEVRA